MKRALKQDISLWMERLGSAVWFIGEHAFVTVILFILGAALIAAILFYQYVIFSPQVQAGAVTSEFKFQEGTLKRLLSDLEQEEEKIKQANFLTPQDLFNP